MGVVGRVNLRRYMCENDQKKGNDEKPVLGIVTARHADDENGNTRHRCPRCVLYKVG